MRRIRTIREHLSTHTSNRKPACFLYIRGLATLVSNRTWSSKLPPFHEQGISLRSHRTFGIHHASITQGMSVRAEVESDSKIEASGLGRISYEVTAKNFLTYYEPPV
ncbi:hypothetical protein AB1N83_006533 [Pleurotus pulmonarius]